MTAASAELFPPPDLGPLRAGVAQVIVAHTYGVTLDDILATSGAPRRAAFARQIAIFLCRSVFAMSVGDLADAFGRTPPTITHALRRVEEMRGDAQFDRTLSWLDTALRAVAGRRA